MGDEKAIGPPASGKDPGRPGLGQVQGCGRRAPLAWPPADALPAGDEADAVPAEVMTATVSTASTPAKPAGNRPALTLPTVRSGRVLDVAIRSMRFGHGRRDLSCWNSALGPGPGPGVAGHVVRLSPISLGVTTRSGITAWIRPVSTTRYEMPNRPRSATNCAWVSPPGPWIAVVEANWVTPAVVTGTNSHDVFGL